MMLSLKIKVLPFTRMCYCTSVAALLYTEMLRILICNLDHHDNNVKCQCGLDEDDCNADED